MIQKRARFTCRRCKKYRQNFRKRGSLQAPFVAQCQGSLGVQDGENERSRNLPQKNLKSVSAEKTENFAPSAGRRARKTGLPFKTGQKDRSSFSRQGRRFFAGYCLSGLPSVQSSSAGSTSRTTQRLANVSSAGILSPLT